MSEVTLYLRPAALEVLTGVWHAPVRVRGVGIWGLRMKVMGLVSWGFDV